MASINRWRVGQFSLTYSPKYSALHYINDMINDYVIICYHYLLYSFLFLNPTFQMKPFLKVTKLDRDPSNGTALQEISFWLNHLERPLLRIQEKRESNEVDRANLGDFKARKTFPRDRFLRHGHWSQAGDSSRKNIFHQ